MYFYSDEHEKNFAVMLKRYPVGNKDPEYRAACYVIAHPEIFHKATKRKWEWPFGDGEESWVDQEDFSHGIRLLIDSARHLYGGGSHPFSLLDGVSTWDTGNFYVFLQACEIRKGWA